MSCKPGRSWLAQRHANWSENFPFTRVGSVPAGEKPFVTFRAPPTPRRPPPRASVTVPWRRIPGADAVMESFFAAAVDAMVAAVCGRYSKTTSVSRPSG